MSLLGHVDSPSRSAILRHALIKARTMRVGNDSLLFAVLKSDATVSLQGESRVLVEVDDITFVEVLKHVFSLNLVGK